ncbi:MAG: hypothetical protein ACHQIL_05305 [Steroidobacterales bacterium]
MLKIRRLALLPALLLLVLPFARMAQADINISVNFAPPEIPVYEQPAIPDDGYLWTPGYWAWDGDQQDYYWVPGTWVPVPQPGYLWTPGYWGSNAGAFIWNDGYWGTQIGFYGGVDYGYGYGGRGFDGGYWQGGHLFYNRSVTNVGTTNITNVYNKTVINNVNVTRVSYNGGSGGVQAQATAGEMAAAHAQHLPPTSAQQQHVQAARSNPVLRASQNHGKPPIAATAKPGVLSGAGVVAAKAGGKVSEPAERKPAAVERQAAPAERKPAPVERQAAPAERKPAPVERQAAPAERKPAPVERQAAPAERKPAPVEHQAAPAERKPEPAERKPEPEHKPGAE